MDVVIGVRMVVFLRRQLQPSDHSIFVWTDSMCVLRWIASTKTKPVFVANRLREIKASRDIKFCYVPTQENPADLASRGVTVDSISTLLCGGIDPHG